MNEQATLAEKVEEIREWAANRHLNWDTPAEAKAHIDTLLAALEAKDTRIATLRETADRATSRADAKDAVIEGMREALKPFAFFIEQWERQPMRGVDDEFYVIHAATEFEASLRRSDCKRAAVALANGLVGEGREKQK